MGWDEDDLGLFLFEEVLGEKEYNALGTSCAKPIGGRFSTRVDALLEAAERFSQSSDLVTNAPYDVRHIALDAEYLDWLEGVGESDGSFARATYAKSLSRHEVYRLWCKHTGTGASLDYVHLFLVEGQEIPYANFTIPHSFTVYMKTQYAKYLHVRSEDIYVHPRLLCPDFYYTSYREAFLYEACERFAGRVPKRFDLAFPRVAHRANMATRILPVAIRVSDAPVYPLSHLLHCNEGAKAQFSQEDLWRWAVRVEGYLPEFEALTPTVCLVPGEDVLFAANLVMEQVQRSAKESGIDFHVE